MIEVIYYRDKHKLTVKGHAKSGEAGHDLICAAASILTYTIASNVLQMAENKRQIRRPKVKLEPGDASVSCSAIHGMDSVVTLVFDAVCQGFDLLAKQYPDNVLYAVRNGIEKA